jgi:monofunctional biosynthetic peptidoglycan transglycosylase
MAMNLEAINLSRILLGTLTLISPSLSGKDQESDQKIPSPRTLMDFNESKTESPWIAVNDGVMGGLSQGSAKIKDGLLHFSGSLSLENNGGFSSIRTPGKGHDLTTAKSMILRVKGDGRTYQLRISTDARFRGSRISYSAEFATKTDEWIEVTVPFATFKPTYRGNALDGPPLDLSKVEEVGLLIGDKRTRSFSLNVDWIKAG